MNDKKVEVAMESLRGKRAGTELITAGLGYRGWRWYGFTLLSDCRGGRWGWTVVTL